MRAARDISDIGIQDQPVIGGASSLLFAMSDGGVNCLLYMRLNGRSLSPTQNLWNRYFCGSGLLVDAVPFDADEARMNVAINLPPHMMAILVSNSEPALAPCLLHEVYAT